MKEMKSLLISASMTLKATILSFENLHTNTNVILAEMLINNNKKYILVFSEEEPDLNSELEVSVRIV